MGRTVNAVLTVFASVRVKVFPKKGTEMSRKEATGNHFRGHLTTVCDSADLLRLSADEL